jgi:cob(I)alamin adenosyltransferase
MAAADGRTDWTEGFVQVYTGNGKGKTTAALGLMLRAVGAGLPVFVAQFAKGMPTSELESIKRFSDRVEIRQFGRDGFIRGEPAAADRDAARDAVGVLSEVIAAGKHRLVILDEVSIATHFGLVSVEDLLALIDAKPAAMELVITGRQADPRVIERADLVTDMREVKHYFRRGVMARRGIEN